MIPVYYHYLVFIPVPAYYPGQSPVMFDCNAALPSTGMLPSPVYLCVMFPFHTSIVQSAWASQHWALVLPGTSFGRPGISILFVLFHLIIALVAVSLLALSSCGGQLLSRPHSVRHV